MPQRRLIRKSGELGGGGVVGEVTEADQNNKIWSPVRVWDDEILVAGSNPRQNMFTRGKKNGRKKGCLGKVCRMYLLLPKRDHFIYQEQR